MAKTVTDTAECRAVADNCDFIVAVLCSVLLISPVKGVISESRTTETCFSSVWLVCC